MQQRAAIWILGAFHISLSFEIETITRLILIHLHLQKLSSRFQLRIQSLPHNYIIKLFLENRHSGNTSNHYPSLENRTPKQQLNVKRSIINANNRLNGVFHSFNPLSIEFSPEHRLIDIFSSCFSFHHLDWKGKESKKAHLHILDELILQTLPETNMAVVVSDASIKNQVATFIAHVHTHNNPIINVTSTEAELFIIKCGINQATQMANINHIIVITNSLHVA